MEALELLSLDHSRLRDLFDAAERTYNRKLHRLLYGQIKADLAAHSALEREIFYPALENFGELTLMTRAAQQEHADFEQLIDRMERESPESEEWGSLFRSLLTFARHHLDVEESEVFPIVERLMPLADRERLGRYMAEMRRDETELAG